MTAPTSLSAAWQALPQARTHLQQGSLRPWLTPAGKPYDSAVQRVMARLWHNPGQGRLTLVTATGLRLHVPLPSVQDASDPLLSALEAEHLRI